MRTIDTDILVVGAGPSGLTASALLARHGVRALTVSRHPGTAHQPRATLTNLRTIEVFRDMGIEARVGAVGYRSGLLNHNVMATSFAGTEIFRYRSYGTAPNRLSDYAAASPCEMLNAPQHVLEPVLLAAAVEQGADVRFFHELVEIEQSDDRVLARIRERGSGDDYLVQAKYAIGADGGRSAVAEQLGFGFDGEFALKHMVNMWVEVDLAKFTAYRPSMIYHIAQPGSESWVGSGACICVRPWNDWLMVREYDPADGEPDTSDAAVAQFARSLIGAETAEVRVKGTSKWEVNHLVATEYRRGRVFLVGDAAHRLPPSGGLGNNTSVQDSFNLAWKLALVLSGRAGERLLDSYHEERQPIGRQVVDRALRSLTNQGAVPQALGFRRGQSPEEGWAALRELSSDVEGAEQRRAALREVVELQNYRSNALGVELGQRYASRAVVADGTPFPPSDRDPELYYQPTTHPGAHLPHAWVEHDRRRVSTLDLAGHGRFCLIAGIGGEPWVQAAAEVSEELGIELPVYLIGYRCEYDDVVADWESVREIGDRGALLVRPDRHVAWRCFERPDSPENALRGALAQVLALDGHEPGADRNSDASIAN